MNLDKNEPVIYKNSEKQKKDSNSKLKLKENKSNNHEITDKKNVKTFTNPEYKENFIIGKTNKQLSNLYDKSINEDFNVNNNYKHFEYLGYLACKDIYCVDQDLMIQWNAFYYKNIKIKNIKNLLIKFIMDRRETFDYPKFIFMFYSKLIIKKSEMIEILKILQ